MSERSDHWDNVFKGSEDHTLGWYEKDMSQTLDLITHVPLEDQKTIFLAGAGTSTLADELLKDGRELILNDISQVALERVKQRVGEHKHVRYICQDIATDISAQLPQLDLWIDRAVLHFLTQDEEIASYVKNLTSRLKLGGYALFAEFSTSGANRCAGLPVKQYDLQTFKEMLGSGFELVKQHDYTYVNPNGDDRPYIYALFKRDH